MSLTKLATFAAGCFWGVEEAFLRSGRVLSTVVGYTGGGIRKVKGAGNSGGGEEDEETNEESPPSPPTYEQVCTGRTGHAEAVQVTYDPNKTSYDDLLDLFWTMHDPTTLNRQGPDVGTQYRSVIFWHDEEQRRRAEESRDRVGARLAKPIVTQIEPADTFYPAEGYHQQYLRKTGRSCHINII